MVTPITEHWTCEDCGSPLVTTESGAACPNGHGRLRPHMPTDIKRRNHAIVALGLRDARQLPGGRYVFDVGGEEYERIPHTRAITRVLDSWPSEVPRDETLAIIEGAKIVRLRPIHQDTGNK